MLVLTISLWKRELIMYLTDEKNVLILVSLLKKRGIKRIIASPGALNIAFVSSVQNDPFFDVFSSVDERSAAYLACGLASETGEPVVLSCTGATASRNYLSGLTEAFYRKLPVIAITSSRGKEKTGHLIPQVIDRSTLPKDVAKISVYVPIVKDEYDWRNCEITINRALIELNRDGGGPIHIDLVTSYSQNKGPTELPEVSSIDYFNSDEYLPELPKGNIAVFVGSHQTWSRSLIESVEKFCCQNNAVVLCDQTSGYKGKYCIMHSISSFQSQINNNGLVPDTIIHIGEVSGDYSAKNIRCKDVWRVSEDGVIRDTFGKLKYVFEMKEEYFFNHYSKENSMIESHQYINDWRKHIEYLRGKITEMPFSNLWIAKEMHNHIPEDSTIHFSILNSLRAWNFFPLKSSIKSFANVGGFGIDGCLSSLIGASLANSNKLFFGVIGDLSFFYDINVIGNRHIKSNVRIMLINNGLGVEFKNYDHNAARFENETNKFIAAEGHFGNKSKSLVRDYSQSLGFHYLSASSKEEFFQYYKQFVSSCVTDKPVIFEIFTTSEDESKALELITSVN